MSYDDEEDFPDAELVGRSSNSHIKLNMSASGAIYWEIRVFAAADMEHGLIERVDAIHQSLIGRYGLPKKDKN